MLSEKLKSKPSDCQILIFYFTITANILTFQLALIFSHAAFNKLHLIQWVVFFSEVDQTLLETPVIYQ